MGLVRPVRPSTSLTWLLFACSIRSLAASTPTQSPPLDEAEQQVEGQGENAEGYEYANDGQMLAAFGVLSCGFWVAVLSTCAARRCCSRRRGPRQGPMRSKRKLVTAEMIEQRFPAARTDENPTCVVCLHPVEESELCRKTVCGHTFHADCILEWWMHKPQKTLRCPICRQRQQRNKSAAKATEESREQPQLRVEDVDEVSPNISELASTILQIDPLDETPHDPPKPPHEDGETETHALPGRLIVDV